MEIRSYQELTDFVFSEYEKMSEVTGVSAPSKKFLRNNEKQLERYVKLYKKPLYKRAKLELRIQQAIDTMPHGKLWQILHADLWRIIQARLQQQSPPPQEKPPEPVTAYPVVQQRGLDQISPQGADYGEEN